MINSSRHFPYAEKVKGNILAEVCLLPLLAKGCDKDLPDSEFGTNDKF